MKPAPLQIIRIGLAITFLWASILIFHDPKSWGGLIQPWVFDLLPLSLETVMIQTAILDLLIGFFLLIDVGTIIFAWLALVHLILIIIVVGITPETVRDIGLIAAALALVWAWWPKRFKKQ